jgi:four helix bundle suffix protein
MPLRQRKEVQKVSWKSIEWNRSYEAYRIYISEPHVAANIAICLIHQANYRLDQQLRALEKAFVEDGGFVECMYRVCRVSRYVVRYTSVI